MNQEYDVAHEFLDRLDSLQEQVQALRKPHSGLFPDVLKDIYVDQFEDAVVSLVRETLGNAMNLDAESRQVLINKDFIRMFAKDLLKP